MGLSDQRRCWLDCIGLSAGSYRIGWIVLYRLDCIRKHWILRIGWLLPGWDGWGGWTGWDVGGTGVGLTEFSRRQNGSATIGTGTGASPLALEGRQAVGSGGWHQFYLCCNGEEYLCRSRKTIQIDCTQI